MVKTNAEHLFLCLLAICTTSLEKHLSDFLPILEQFILDFLTVVVGFLIFLNINLLSDV